jgi:hypothetical protein
MRRYNCRMSGIWKWPFAVGQAQDGGERLRRLPRVRDRLPWDHDRVSPRPVRLMSRMSRMPSPHDDGDFMRIPPLWRWVVRDADTQCYSL